MAQQPLIIHPKYWGACTHEECHKANHPHDAYLKLYNKQYPNSSNKIKSSGKCNSLIHQLELTMSVLNPTINDILFDDTLWSKHFRYKHKNPSYLNKQITETFYEWYNNISPTHQIPLFKQRNCISLVPITTLTDNNTYFIDDNLITKLRELCSIFYGLNIKLIDISNQQNVISKSAHQFISSDIHDKLGYYYKNDLDIFCIIGICCKIGIYSKENKVCHGESNQYTQSAICSFSKLGIYNKKEKNIPEWLKIRRTGKILLHEIGHLYGISHCEYFRCLMNKDVVLDNVPMTLCPVCLNKLYYSMIKYNLYRNTFEPDHININCNININTSGNNINNCTGIQLLNNNTITCNDNDFDGVASGDESGTDEGPSSGLTDIIDDIDDIADDNIPTVANAATSASAFAVSAVPVDIDIDDDIIDDDDDNCYDDDDDDDYDYDDVLDIDHNTFNLLQRYEKLAEWFNEHKLFREATWYKNRLQALKIKSGL